MAIRSARERLWQALAFELGGLAMVAPVYGLIMGAGAAESVALVAAVAVAAAVWSPLHNHLFDAAEWRMAGRVASDRPARLRMVHAVSHEASTTIITLPVIMVVGGHGFWAALAIDLAMTAFYAAYTYVFAHSQLSVDSSPQGGGGVRGLSASRLLGGTDGSLEHGPEVDVELGELAADLRGGRAGHHLGPRELAALDRVHPGDVERQISGRDTVGASRSRTP
jgi:uncharacterized membrane protein